MSRRELLSNIASACVLASGLFGLRRRPAVGSVAALALVPMLLLGLQYGRRGVVFSTFALITAGCFDAYEAESRRIDEQSASDPGACGGRSS